MKAKNIIKNKLVKRLMLSILKAKLKFLFFFLTGIIIQKYTLIRSFIMTNAVIFLEQYWYLIVPRNFTLGFKSLGWLKNFNRVAWRTFINYKTIDYLSMSGINDLCTTIFILTVSTLYKQNRLIMTYFWYFSLF